MKRLFHLSTTFRQLDMFEEDWEQIEAFVEKQNIDGIELGLTLDYEISQIPKDIVKGVHLSFYPMWLDFWQDNKEKLATLFDDEAACYQYYKAKNKQELIECYTRQYERAKALEAEYMVFHVSHVLPEDSFFTHPLSYSDKEVMEAAIELINAAFPMDADGPLLLFENLWWPGLNYQDPKLTEWFIQEIKYPNKGYLVDVSHLILNSEHIGTEKEAYRYIKEIMMQLGETKQWIKGMHLNKTLPKYYRKRDFKYLLEQYKNAKDSRQKLMILKKHINALDGHQPFDHPIAKQIVDLIQPEFCVYETAPSSRHELAYFIKKQNQALDIQ